MTKFCIVVRIQPVPSSFSNDSILCVNCSMTSFSFQLHSTSWKMAQNCRKLLFHTTWWLSVVALQWIAFVNNSLGFHVVSWSFHESLTVLYINAIQNCRVIKVNWIFILRKKQKCFFSPTFPHPSPVESMEFFFSPISDILFKEYPADIKVF